MADKIEEVKTVCWCGKKATFNARFDQSGKVLKEGAQVVLGANDQYIGLCRRHWMAGDLGPDFHVPREEGGESEPRRRGNRTGAGGIFRPVAEATADLHFMQIFRPFPGQGTKMRLCPHKIQALGDLTSLFKSV